MYDILLILHSLLRYALVFAAVFAIYRAFTGWQNKQAYTSLDNKASVFLVMFMHTQLLIGFLLYFVFSPFADLPVDMKNAVLRFWKVEHIALMILAVVFFQVGRIVSKKATEDVIKHKKAFIFYTIGFVILMAGIPWPFSKVARAFLPF